MPVLFQYCLNQNILLKKMKGFDCCSSPVVKDFVCVIYS